MHSKYKRRVSRTFFHFSPESTILKLIKRKNVQRIIMKDDSQSPDNTQEFKLRPRDIVKIREILASRDAGGNPRFLDEREVITRALEVFFAWELEPENFMIELKKIEAINPYQKQLLVGMLSEQTKLQNAIFEHFKPQTGNVKMTIKTREGNSFSRRFCN